jgi:transcriptional regulator with XRE-family HTH domain
MSVDIGERIRSLRTARGLSQEEVARRTGIGLKSYGDLERGRTKDPHYSTLRGVARALGVRVEELIEEPAVPLDEAPQKTALADADPSSKLIEAEVLEEIAELWKLPPSEASALLEYLLRTGMLSGSELQEAREEGVRRELATGASR